MTEQEKPVAIFLPQHRPGRVSGPSRPIVASVLATVVILGGSLFFMMPRGEVALASMAAADADEVKSVRSVSLAASAQDGSVATLSSEEAEAAMTGTPQAAKPPTSAVAAAVPPSKTAKAVDVPRKDDPRWARAETKQGSAALEAVRKLIIEKAAQVDETDSALLAYAGGERNANFSDPDDVPRRPMQIVLPAELPEQPDAAVRTAAVNAPVNMRRGPGSKHGVLMVIPRRAKVEIFGCDLWCKVGYEGRTGYIYKSFVSGRSS